MVLKLPLTMEKETEKNPDPRAIPTHWQDQGHDESWAFALRLFASNYPLKPYNLKIVLMMFTKTV